MSNICFFKVCKFKRIKAKATNQTIIVVIATRSAFPWRVFPSHLGNPVNCFSSESFNLHIILQMKQLILKILIRSIKFLKERYSWASPELSQVAVSHTNIMQAKMVNART